jgi:hypothetical protein
MQKTENGKRQPKSDPTHQSDLKKEPIKKERISTTDGMWECGRHLEEVLKC